jgi:hypothetical protein
MKPKDPIVWVEPAIALLAFAIALAAVFGLCWAIWSTW